MIHASSMDKTATEFPVWHAGRQDTVTAALRRAASEHADRVYLDFGGQLTTYADVDRLSNRLAHGLAGLGVRQGDRVASLLDNSLDAVLAWFAINKLGAVSVPVNTAYKGEFLRHQLDDCGAKVLIAEADYAQRIAGIETGLPHAMHLVQRGGAPVLASRLQVHALAALPGSDAALPDPNQPADLAMLIYTAGTTGPSKGCMISHNYVCNLGRQVVQTEQRLSSDCNWTALPLFHLNATGGSLLSAMFVGGRVAIYPRFSVSNFWPEIERSGATIASLLGSMVAFIANAPDSEVAQRCFGQLHTVRGSPFPAALQAKWKERFGVRVAGSNSYGLTEAARVTNTANNGTAPPDSSGRCNDDFDVRIVDDHDNEVAAGTPGEIVVRPRRPHVMFEGYWNRTTDTLKIMKNLWLHTGDIGKFDEQGFLYFVDRKKDYLRRRGENISSYEVETAFAAHPAIAEVAVHAVLAESGEDDVKATLVLKPGVVLTELELCRWAVDQMPYFTIPRFLEFRDDLPRNPVGRVLKYQLRDEGCTPSTWDREKAGFEIAKR